MMWRDLYVKYGDPAAICYLKEKYQCGLYDNGKKGDDCEPDNKVSVGK